jgi:hypothetical protein
MRTLGRILIILFVFALIMGVTYTIVNASSPSSPGGPANRPSFEREDGERPEIPGGGRPEGFRGEEEGEGRGLGFGLGMILGAIRNSAIIGVIVAVVVKFKDRMRKKRQDSQIPA